MKLDLASGPLKDKQTLVAIGLIAVIVIAGGWVVYSNFFAGSEGGETTETAPMAPPGMGVAPMPNPPPGAEAGNPAGQPPGTTPPPGPPGVAPPPGTGPAGAAPPPSGALPPGAGSPPGAAPPTAAAPSAPAAAPPAPAPAPAPAAKPGQPRTITVFGSVTVTYPSGWGIDLRSAGSAAVFTDGKAVFEIHAPNPKASDAKAIADSALLSFAKGGKATSQGPVRLSGFDAYQYTFGSTRIIGVDAPTRVAIVERVKSGSMSAYRAAFDKMESEMRFR